MSKPRFAFDKHKNTGSKLKRIRNELLTLSVEISNSYAHTTKVSRLGKKAVDALDQLKCALENQMFKDCPTQTSGDNWKGIYYGTPRLEVVRPRGT